MFHTRTPSSKSLLFATVFLGVALAGLVAAAKPQSPKSELTATFKFPKQSYVVGEKITGTLTLLNQGPKVKVKTKYSAWLGKDLVVHGKTVTLAENKDKVFEVGEQARKPGQLEVSFTVTKPRDKKFKKVFTHTLRVEAKNATTAMPGPSASSQPTASTFNCGNNLACARQHILQCTPGATWEAGITGTVVYQYILKAKSATHCTVEQKFTQNPNPVFVGPTMDCTIPLSALSEFAEVGGVLFQRDNYRSCTGRLKEAFINPAAFLGL